MGTAVGDSYLLFAVGMPNSHRVLIAARDATDEATLCYVILPAAQDFATEKQHLHKAKGNRRLRCSVFLGSAYAETTRSRVAETHLAGIMSLLKVLGIWERRFALVNVARSHWSLTVLRGSCTLQMLFVGFLTYFPTDDNSKKVVSYPQKLP